MKKSAIDNISLINQVVLESMNASSERQIFKNFIQVAVKILKADYGYSFLWDSRAKQFKLFYKDPHTPFISKVPRKTGVTATVFHNKEPKYFSQTGQSSEIRSDARLHMKGVVVIPVAYRRHDYGTLDICFYTSHQFTKEEQILCNYIGSSTAQAIALRRFHAELEQLVEKRTLQLRQSKEKIAEEQAKDQAILSSIGEGIVATDQDEYVIAANAQAEIMLGYAKAEMLGKKWSSLVEAYTNESELIPNKQRSIHKALLGEKASLQCFYVRKDKSRLPVAVTDSPVIRNNTIIGAVLVFRDITKEMEVDRAKTEFVSLTSHQLRTPLSAINWYTEAILNEDTGKLAPQQKKYLGEIRRANRRMIDLVNDMLNTSRLELGTFVVEVKPVNIEELVAGVINELQPMIAQKHIIFTKILKPEAVNIDADPKLIKIVIQNLLVNAVKYTPPRGEVGLSIKPSPKKNPVAGILITVTDTGYGIPKRQAGKIFTKLFRADNVKARDTDGTGLGLYIVKSVVEFCGGKIWFSSKEDKGSTFSVFLPFDGLKSKERIKTP